MADHLSLLPSRPPLRSPRRQPVRHPAKRPGILSRRVRTAVLGLGVSSPVIADGHVLNGLSLPLLFAIVGCMATVSTAIGARAMPPLFARIAARRSDAALVRRLASLCCMGDFPQRQKRVSDLVAFLARKASLSRRDQKLLATASTLHRIGMVSLPPCPPGDHDDVARRAARIAGRLLSGSTPLHRAATGMAVSHEESWDGGGLPGSLAGAAIPFPARLLQVALALDALLPRTGSLPDHAQLASIAARVQAEGGRTLDPQLASLPCRHLVGLESLISSQLTELNRADRCETQGGWWTRIAQTLVLGRVLTPA